MTEDLCLLQLELGHKTGTCHALSLLAGLKAKQLEIFFRRYNSAFYSGFNHISSSPSLLFFFLHIP